MFHPSRYSFITTTAVALILLLGVCLSSTQGHEVTPQEPVAFAPPEPLLLEETVRVVLGKIIRETLGTLVNSGGDLCDTLIDMHNHASSFVTRIQLNATFGHSKVVGQKVLGLLRMAFFETPFGRRIIDVYIILADYIDREVAAPYAEYQRGIEKLVKVATVQFGHMVDKLGRDLRIMPTGGGSQET